MKKYINKLFEWFGYVPKDSDEGFYYCKHQDSLMLAACMHAIMKTIKINEGILKCINNHKPPFEFIPKLGSLWKVKREISYPNVNGGYSVIELSNSKGKWLRLPKCIIDNE